MGAIMEMSFEKVVYVLKPLKEMAPTGENKPFEGAKEGPISPIDDLDSAGTVRSQLQRIKSFNNAAVFRPAKCLASATKENDDVNGETSKMETEVPEECLADGKLCFVKTFYQKFFVNLRFEVSKRKQPF